MYLTSIVLVVDPAYEFNYLLQWRESVITVATKPCLVHYRPGQESARNTKDLRYSKIDGCQSLESLDRTWFVKCGGVIPILPTSPNVMSGKRKPLSTLRI